MLGIPQHNSVECLEDKIKTGMLSPASPLKSGKEMHASNPVTDKEEKCVFLGLLQLAKLVW